MFYTMKSYVKSYHQYPFYPVPFNPLSPPNSNFPFTALIPTVIFFPPSLFVNIGQIILIIVFVASFLLLNVCYHLYPSS